MAQEVGSGAGDSAQPKASLKEERFMDWSALTSISFGGTQMLIIVAVAIAVIATWFAPGTRFA